MEREGHRGTQMEGGTWRERSDHRERKERALPVPPSLPPSLPVSPSLSLSLLLFLSLSLSPPLPPSLPPSSLPPSLAPFLPPFLPVSPYLAPPLPHPHAPLLSLCVCVGEGRTMNSEISKRSAAVLHHPGGAGGPASERGRGEERGGERVWEVCVGGGEGERRETEGGTESVRERK